MSGTQIERLSPPESARAHTLLQSLLTRAGARCAFVFSLDQYWLPHPQVLTLLVVAESVSRGSDPAQSLRVVIGPCPEHVPAKLDNVSLEQIAQQFDAALFDLARPWTLKPLEIPKPWGREIWFTGVEARGVCRVEQGPYSAPIPWLLEVCGPHLAGAADRKLVLLKILDPLPEAVFGDLYVELHERKQEVYVVTQVDRTAWPDGVGAIRFGFNQAMVTTFDSESAFREAYVDAVERYRAVRVEIDALLDRERERRGIGLNDPVSAQTQQQWLSTLPPPLLQRESSLRAQMDAFYGSLPLRVGDVIKVPCFVPHSLQHGVTTIEFQTPVYERKILSFAQKVLTQSHWDTQDAMSLCGVGAVEPGALQPIPAAPGVRVERIVDFDSFEVFRLTLAANVEIDLASLLPCCNYLILMVVSGALALKGDTIESSTAMLLGVMSSPWKLRAAAADTVIVVANPKRAAID